MNSESTKKTGARIEIRGAREHNLKNLSLTVPRNKLVVITGPSGSGKSTLAFDTLFSEGQRRYIESLSAYAKQFIEQLKKPDVESIRGLCPSIAIQQRGISKNPRSTVGTLTEIYDFLRLLFSLPIQSQTTEEIIDQILRFDPHGPINILAILAHQKKGEFFQEIDRLVRMGLVRARIDGENRSLEKGMRLERNKPHTLEVYIDRLYASSSARKRIEEAVKTASSLTGGAIHIEDINHKKIHLFNEKRSCPHCGRGFPELTPRLFSFNSPVGACPQCRGLGFVAQEEEDLEVDLPCVREPCSACQGKRLCSESLSVLVDDKNIDDLCRLSLEELRDAILLFTFEKNRAVIAEKILKEINNRICFLNEVGLGYLSLNRLASSLSGGEEQRVRLATQIGSPLTGVLYVLDEPSIGLHQVDNKRLLQSLQRLKNNGNTVIVVEHDAETILAADHVIDLGPGAGRFGGFLMDEGPPHTLQRGLTAEFLSGRRQIALPKIRRSPQHLWLEIVGANLHNLKNIPIKIPLGVFTVVTGVSGSGKSTLIMNVLCQTIKDGTPVGCQKIIGLEHIDKLVEVDQSPIGRSSRSNPATYIGVFGLIRSFFAQTPQAKIRGYSPSRFSFNVGGGRCGACGGAGQLDIEMHLLPHVTVPCEVCEERRYNQETLAVCFKGKNIYDMLEMTFEEAADFFKPIPSVHFRLEVLKDVGLGYLKLGQPAPSLSGGEAQRVKLAKELCRKTQGKTLYVFDEPTTGLHFVDIEKLLLVLQRLVDSGHSVLIIEHHMDIIKSADYLIDLGPGAGKEGGWVVAAGSPENIIAQPRSQTGPFLKKFLHY